MKTGTVRTYYVEYEEATGRTRYLEKLNAEKDSEIARLHQIYEIERKEKERVLALNAELEQRNKEAEAQLEALDLLQNLKIAQDTHRQMKSDIRTFDIENRADK